MKALAITWVYNEVDILAHYVRHQVEQGIDVFLLDNWSEDGSYELGLELSRNFEGVMIERAPDKRPTEMSWADMLELTEIVARDSHYPWCIHQDADEFSFSPARGERVIDAIKRVDALGYNAIDHSMYMYMPVDSYDPCVSPILALTTPFHKNDEWSRVRGREVKVWKQTPGVRVSLIHSAGHDVLFDGLKVYPEPLIKKHYPYRTHEHKKRKVASRKSRWSEHDRKLVWHVHYDNGSYP